MEKIVETKTCRHCSTSFHITDKDLEFYEKVSPVFSCRDTICRDMINRVSTRKYPIPTPTLCPDCRTQQRFSWRNERKLYHRKCDFSGKQMISIYSPDKPYKVYSVSDWHSDKWDGMDYGRDFDFSRSFFEQFNDLLLLTPKIGMFAIDNENSDYSNGTQKNKDCYMIFVSDRNDSCFYSYSTFGCKDSIDCTNCKESELLVECIDCSNSYNLKYCQNTHDSRDSSFLYDCKNCQNCIGSFGLRGKQYYILNKPYSKEDYYEKLKELDFGNKDIFKKVKELYEEKSKNNKIHIFCNGNNNENVSGDYITNCKNVKNCYDSDRLEDCKNLIFSFDSNNCHDGHVVVDKSELCYQTVSTISQYKCFSCFGSWYSKNSYYLDHSIRCENCFGCSSIKDKQYCIFNKQYTKEQYEKLVPKIIEHMMKTGEWGEFFPSSISPFGYNETVAQEYFPLSRDVSLKHLFKWSDYEKQNGYDGEFYIPVEISNYDEKKVGKEIAEKNKETLLKGILKCEISGKPFRIISQELEFYMKHNLPIPKRHPDQRHLDRMKMRNPRKLRDRKCDKCGKEMKTTYATDREEIVYCEECYEKEVY